MPRGRGGGAHGVWGWVHLGERGRGKWGVGAIGGGQRVRGVGGECMGWGWGPKQQAAVGA